MNNTDTVVTIYDDDDREITVTANVIPPSRGQRDQYGAPLEPDTDAEIEIVSATCYGEEIDLQADLRQRAIDELWQMIGEL